MPPLSTYTFLLPSFVSSRSERRASRGRAARPLYAAIRNVPMPELCLSYAPRYRDPRSPLATSGQRSTHPLPSRSPFTLSSPFISRSPGARASSSYSLRSPLAYLVLCLCGHPCLTRSRRHSRVFVAYGVGGMQAYVGRSSETAGQQDLTTRVRDYFYALSRVWRPSRLSLKNQRMRETLLVSSRLDYVECN